MTKIIISGANGKMGQVLKAAAATTDDMCVVAGIDKFPDTIKNSFTVFPTVFDCTEKADVIIDFSRPDALADNLSFAKQNGLSIVIATTGFNDEEKKMIKEASKDIPVFFSANMSLGVNLQMQLSKKAAAFLGESYDIEIVEKHHNQKEDAPSGTALAIADCINETFSEPKEYEFGRHTTTQKRGREIGLHAVRGGTISGEHCVLFIGTDEIIEINHIAQSKQIFAYGAIRAAKFIAGKPAGLYDMNDIIADSAVSNIYKDGGQAMVTITDFDFSPAAVAKVFDVIAEKGIKLDIISQTAPHNDQICLSFSMPRSDINACVEALKPYVTGAAEIIANDTLTKLTVEGAGMQRQSGVASRLFGALAEKNISIYIITTSETEISFCVDTNKAKDAISVVSEAFCL